MNEGGDEMSDAPDPEVRYEDFSRLLEMLRRPVSNSKTWTYNYCTCDYLADEHEPDCPSLTPPYTIERS